MYKGSSAISTTLTRRQWLTISGLALAGAVTGIGEGSTDAAKRTTDVQAGNTPGNTARQKAINVAVVLGAHNTLIDVAGPWEILSSAAYAGGGFNVYSVAAVRAPVICDDGRGVASMQMGNLPLSGLTVIPDFTFEDAPQPRVTIIGAQVNHAQRETLTLEWIRHAAQKAELTASVCTGAYLLAKSGLLDGKSATTNRNAYDDFEKTFPKVKLVRGVRFVDSGSVASATGLTAGMDLSMHIVERFYGRKVAQELADYEEWPSKAWIRA
ncbi:MAG: DJ-1/PfpI family protein [Steroidobacteraceae bacterium]